MDRTHFRAAHAFDADGLYVYKRPVRTGDEMAELLSQAGTVLHHVVLYVRCQGKVNTAGRPAAPATCSYKGRRGRPPATPVPPPNASLTRP